VIFFETKHAKIADKVNDNDFERLLAGMMNGLTRYLGEPAENTWHLHSGVYKPLSHKDV
jgi:hypothetical protein